MSQFLCDVPYGVNATYMTESFETSVRATAVGGADNIGRVAAAIAPALIGFIATRHSIGVGLMVMSGAYLLTGLIPALFIREKMFDPHVRPELEPMASPAGALSNVRPAHERA